MSHCHHTRNQFDEPHERMRGGWSDNHEGGGRRDAPDPYFGSRHDDYGYNHGDAPAPPMQQHEGANLGWGDAAWDDAGGFESVLWGHLANNFGPAGGSPPVIVFAIDDLNVEFNTLIQITQIQNTLALLNASNGGSIDVGGDITAIGLQSASAENFAGFMNLPDFA